jgi:TPP-dependent pyruvate/acetoin dehydrogenase alpha subunit
MTSKAKKQSADAGNSFSLISSEKLLALYVNLLKCRMIVERAQALAQRGALTGGGCDCAGQEAVVVGVALDLLPEDTAYSADGSLIAKFIKGVALDTVFRDLIDGAHCVDNVRTAMDTALVNKTEKNGKIAVVFSGGSSVTQQSWQEALNFACIEKLPVLFVSQNDMAPDPPSVEPQAGNENVQVLKYPCISVDRNDVVAVYRVASEAVTHARMGHGPTLIECRAFRLSGPAAMGLGKGLQPKETARQAADDPILNMEKYLTGKGLFSEEFKKRVALEFNNELETAIDTLENAI